MLSYQSWKFVKIRVNGGRYLRMAIITNVFVINENIYHSLILLVCGYLLICNMQQFSHYKKWCLCPIFCEIALK